MAAVLTAVAILCLVGGLGGAIAIGREAGPMGDAIAFQLVVGAIVSAALFGGLAAILRELAAIRRALEERR